MRVRESCGCALADARAGAAACAWQQRCMTERPLDVMPRPYDVLAMGRSSIDLYAHEIGRPITEVRSFDAYVGGCPTNVSVGTRRLGLRSVLLTAVGDDQVGDFVTAFLEREQVETRFIPRKTGRRTSAVILTIQPPDSFPLTFYRDNCADRALTVDDVERAPDRREPRRVPDRHRPEPRAGARRDASRPRPPRATPASPVVVDIDYRADQWDSAAGVLPRRFRRCFARRRSPSARKRSSPPRPARRDAAARRRHAPRRAASARWC